MAKVLTVVGILALGAAGWGYCVAAQTRSSVLEINDSALQALASRPLRPGEYEVIVYVRNISAQPQRVLSVTSSCFDGCCFAAAQPLPIGIPADSSVRVTVKVEISAHSGEEFHGAPKLLLDDNGVIREHQLAFDGRIALDDQVPKVLTESNAHSVK
ncbi:MAG: hypothetical protein MPJ50_05030 [Pirellulales bacterium]|nr:hypothetical protein [Pirellulales bacterium]